MSTPKISQPQQTYYRPPLPRPLQTSTPLAPLPPPMRNPNPNQSYMQPDQQDYNCNQLLHLANNWRNQDPRFSQPNHYMNYAQATQAQAPQQQYQYHNNDPNWGYSNGQGHTSLPVLPQAQGSTQGFHM